jgi:hypothetical protein
LLVNPPTESQPLGKGPLPDEDAEDLVSKNAKFIILEVIPVDICPAG